jgi:hypothetical protein
VKVKVSGIIPIRFWASFVGDPIAFAQSQGRGVLDEQRSFAQRISPLDEAIRNDPAIKALGEESRRFAKKRWRSI